ncbi:MAG: bifunctional 3,4-dihydroxy-2-butanone-4-phosphate synthase/GTP cyclohydrolase II [Nitrospirae bacterium]|nr:bifunctional 3,4-dihydroxy-2-butanone-4-phosphate synthase/GTP cyclohydrolase II [Nitrospirota bacterium]
MSDPSPFNTIPEAIEAIRQGRMVILVDDEDRENEGDLVMAAQDVTAEAVNFMAREGRGLICLSLEEAQVERLQLPPMASVNTSPYSTAFTVSIEAREGVTTGISAHDRAVTIKKAADPDCLPYDLVRPGHVFPLKAVKGGVLRRAGQTEGSVDLARLAGKVPAGAICEIMKDDGTMARVPDLLPYARRHGLPLVTIKDLIAYRIQNETLVKRCATAKLPTDFGEFTAIVYENEIDHDNHVALVKGDISHGTPLVRVHSGCLTGDVFSSQRCDCQAQLRYAMRAIEEYGTGVILYMQQEGRGIGLANKIRAYALQDEGMDTVEANEKLGFKPDLRDYGVGAQILMDLGLRKIRLMTNNPRKIVGLGAYKLEVVERVPVEIAPGDDNRKYLSAKKHKLGHLLNKV